MLGVEGQWEESVLGTEQSIASLGANQLGVSLTRVQVPYLYGLGQVPSSFGVSVYLSITWAFSNGPGTI